MFMLPSCSLEKLLPDGVGEKNRKWAVMLALSSPCLTSPAPGLYFFIVVDACVGSWKPLSLPWAFSTSLSLFLWPHFSGMIPSGLGLCVCVWLYVHLFFQQNNIISLIFYLAASSIPPEESSLPEPLALRSYLCFSGFSPDPMSAQTIHWQCRSRGAEKQRAWLIKETTAKIDCET